MSITDIERAATAIHAGQLDLQDAPYTDHLRAVADSVSPRAKPLAWLHDSLEDQPARATAGGQLARLLDADELAALTLLTRSKSESYRDYILRIRSWPGLAGALAREVKIADLEHNLGRITPAVQHDHPHLADRYRWALQALKSAP